MNTLKNNIFKMQSPVICTFQQINILTGVFLTSVFVLNNPAQAQRACVITDAGNVVCGRLQQSGGKSSNENSTKQQTSRGFLFDFKGCKKIERDEVTCIVMVTNTKSEERVLTFAYWSSISMIDSAGNTYTWNFAGGFGRQGESGARLSSGVPVRLVATFRGVPSDAQPVALNLEGNGDVKVQFR